MLEWFHVLAIAFSSYWLFLAAGIVLRFLLRKTSKPWVLPIGLLIAAVAAYLFALSLGGEQWPLLAVLIACIYGAVGAVVCGIVLRVLARKKELNFGSAHMCGVVLWTYEAIRERMEDDHL